MRKRSAVGGVQLYRVQAKIKEVGPSVPLFRFYDIASASCPSRTGTGKLTISRAANYDPYIARLRCLISQSRVGEFGAKALSWLLIRTYLRLRAGIQQRPIYRLAFESAANSHMARGLYSVSFQFDRVAPEIQKSGLEESSVMQGLSVWLSRTSIDKSCDGVSPAEGPFSNNTFMQLTEPVSCDPASLTSFSRNRRSN